MNLKTRKPEKNSSPAFFVFWFPGSQIFSDALEGRMSDNQLERFTQEIAPRWNAPATPRLSK